jgi:hypothetical protein
MSAHIQALIADFLVQRGLVDRDGFAMRAASAVPRGAGKQEIAIAIAQTRTNLFQTNPGQKKIIINGLASKIASTDRSNKRSDHQRQYVVLLLSANPLNSKAQLALDEEVRGIREVLKRTKGVVKVKLIDRWAVRPGDILQYLNDHRVDVMHFSGHGCDGMIFSDGNHGEVVLTTRALNSLFRHVKGHVKFTVLNYCDSIDDARIAAAHLGYAIGMRRPIGDDCAAVFSAGLYRALAAGKSIPNAFKEAKLEIALHGFDDDDVPVLLTRRKRASRKPMTRSR